MGIGKFIGTHDETVDTAVVAPCGITVLSVGFTDCNDFPIVTDGKTVDPVTHGRTVIFRPCKGIIGVIFDKDTILTAVITPVETLFNQGILLHDAGL